MTDKVSRAEVRFDITGTALETMRAFNQLVQDAQRSLAELGQATVDVSVKPIEFDIPEVAPVVVEAKAKTGAVRAELNSILGAYEDKRLSFKVDLEGEEGLLASLAELNRLSEDGLDSKDKLGDNIAKAFKAKSGEFELKVDAKDFEDSLKFLTESKTFASLQEDLDDLDKVSGKVITDIEDALKGAKGEFSLFVKGFDEIPGADDDALAEAIGRIEAPRGFQDFSSVTEELAEYDKLIQAIKEAEDAEKERRKQLEKDAFLSQAEIFENLRSGKFKRVADLPDDITQVVRGGANVLEATGSNIGKDILERFVLASDTVFELGGSLGHYNRFLEDTVKQHTRTGLSVGLLIRGFERLTDELETPERALAAFGLQADLINAGLDDASAVAVKVADAYRGQTSAIADLGEEYVQMIPNLDRLSHAERQRILPELLAKWAKEQAGDLPVWQKGLQAVNNELYLAGAEAAAFIQKLGPLGTAVPLVAGGFLLLGGAIAGAIYKGVDVSLNKLVELDKGSSLVAKSVSRDFDLLLAETLSAFAGGSKNVESIITAIGQEVYRLRLVVRENKDEFHEWGITAAESAKFATGAFEGFIGPTVLQLTGLIDLLRLQNTLTSSLPNFLIQGAQDFGEVYIPDEVKEPEPIEAPVVEPLDLTDFLDSTTLLARLLEASREDYVRLYERADVESGYGLTLTPIYDGLISRLRGLSEATRNPYTVVVTMDDTQFILNETLKGARDFLEDNELPFHVEFSEFVEGFEQAADKNAGFMNKLVDNVKARLADFYDTLATSTTGSIVNFTREFNTALNAVLSGVDDGVDSIYAPDPEALHFANQALERKNTLSRAEIELAKSLKEEEVSSVKSTLEGQKEKLEVARKELENLKSLRLDFLNADPEQFEGALDNLGDGAKEYRDKLAQAELEVDAASVGLQDLEDRLVAVTEEARLWDEVLHNIGKRVEGINQSRQNQPTIRELEDEIGKHSVLRLSLQTEVDLLKEALAERKARGFVDEEIVKAQSDKIKANELEIISESQTLSALKQRLAVFKQIGDFEQSLTSFNKLEQLDNESDALRENLNLNRQNLAIERDKLATIHEYIQALERAKQAVPQQFYDAALTQGGEVESLQRTISRQQALLPVLEAQEFAEWNLIRVRERSFELIGGLADITYSNAFEAVAGLDREKAGIREKIKLLEQELVLRKQRGLFTDEAEQTLSELQVELTVNEAQRDQIINGFTSGTELFVNSMTEALEGFANKFQSSLADWASGDLTNAGLTENFEDSISDIGATLGTAGGAALGASFGPGGVAAGSALGGLFGAIGGGLIERFIETDAEKAAKRERERKDNEDKRREAERRHKEALDRIRDLLTLTQGIFDNSTLFLEQNRRVDNVTVDAYFQDETIRRSVNRTEADRLLY